MLHFVHFISMPPPLNTPFCLGGGLRCSHSVFVVWSRFMIFSWSQRVARDSPRRNRCPHTRAALICWVTWHEWIVEMGINRTDLEPNTPNSNHILGQAQPYGRRVFDRPNPNRTVRTRRERSMMNTIRKFYTSLFTVRSCTIPPSTYITSDVLPMLCEHWIVIH